MNRQHPHVSIEEIQKVIDALEEQASKDLTDASDAHRWFGVFCAGLLGWFYQLKEAEQIIEKQGRILDAHYDYFSAMPCFYGDLFPELVEDEEEGDED